MNPETVTAQVIRVVDVRRGDVLAVCPPPGDVWSMDQADGLRRHLGGRFADRGIEVLILRSNAHVAALRKADDLEDDIEEDDEPVHGYFGLTYANYQVLHRSLMQSMPVEWQRRMVACLRELDDAFNYLEHPPAYIVEPAREVDYNELTAAERQLLGVKKTGDRYYDRDGDEHDGHDRTLIPLPGGDPIPHYNRGRTRVEPQMAGASA